MRPYVDCLIRELEQTKELIRSKKIKVRAVYVGGGTPTSVGAELLDEVLAHCHFGGKEFTVEAGRPDTINKDVADVLKKHGVTRISVNPQTRLWRLSADVINARIHTTRICLSKTIST